MEDYFLKERGLWLRKGYICYILEFQTLKTGKNRQKLSMTKKKVIKWNCFPKKGHSKMLVRQIFVRPPKLGAKSPPPMSIGQENSKSTLRSSYAETYMYMCKSLTCDL